MKELAIVGLIIFLVFACSFFVIGLGIPQMKTMGNEIVELEGKVQSLEGELIVETEAKGLAESETNDLKAQLEQAAKELQSKQYALDQTLALNTSLQGNLFKLTDDLEKANQRIKGLEVQLDIASQLLAAARAPIEPQSAEEGLAEQGDEKQRGTVLANNLLGSNGAAILIGVGGLGIVIGAGAMSLRAKIPKKNQMNKAITLGKEKRKEGRMQSQPKRMTNSLQSNGRSRRPGWANRRSEQPAEMRRKRNDAVNFPETDLYQLIRSYWLDS